MILLIACNSLFKNVNPEVDYGPLNYRVFIRWICKSRQVPAVLMDLVRNNTF